MYSKLNLYLIKIFTIAFLNIFNIQECVAVNTKNTKVENYLNKVIQESKNILKDRNVDEQKLFTQVFVFINNNLDIEWMARYTLGRNRRLLNDEQISKFTDVYAKHITSIYIDLLKNYNNESINIDHIQQIEDDNEFIVKARVIKPSGAKPLQINYYIVYKTYQPNNTQRFKIADIITEGVSMINSQQSEFNSIINQYGFERLIDKLEQKVK